MTIANVTLNNTFDEWRTVTNQLITFVNEVDGQQLINAASNTAVLTVSPNKILRNETLYISLNVSSDILDNSTLNVATANAVNNVYTLLSDTSARLILVSDNANTINSVANAAIIQANTARNQANTARDHANAAFAVANTALIAIPQANTGRDHANASFEKANSAYELASAVSGNTIPIIEANKAGFLQANLAYEQANTARVHANVSFDQANTARIHANASFAAANAGLIQANTARDHANTAHSTGNASFATANAGLIQANTARIHANQAFEKANAALPNTSGVSFAGNLQIPTGNLTLGSGTNQGIRLSVTDHTAIANVFPQIRTISGSQFVQFNANTNSGGWNDLMLDRDISIIFSRGTSDDKANIVIGPWTDSSFGYKQDGEGRHGFNTSNPRYVVDANGSANISGTLIVSGTNLIDYLSATGAGANVYTRTVGDAGNSYMLTTGASVGAGANVYTRTVGEAGNNYMLTTGASVGAGANVYTRTVGTAGNNYMLTTGVSIGAGANAYAVGIGVGIGAGANAFSSSATNLTTGTVPAARMSGSYTGITGVGTLTAGTWQATAIGLAYGGTNASLTASAGAILYSTASAFALSSIGSSGQLLTSAGAGIPTWTSPSTLSVNYATSAGSATSASSATTFTSTTQDSQFNSIGVGTAPSGVGGEIRATNNVTAYYSDRRLKKDIQKIENALEKVSQISGVTFRSNEEAVKYGYTDTKKQVGVIAQEIEAVLPEVVVPAPFDIGQNEDGTEYSKSGQNYKTVQYDKLIPLLIEAIKELKSELELLKTNKGN